MKYKNIKRINSIPEWVRAIVLPIIILLIIPFGIMKIIEFIPTEDTTSAVKQYLQTGINLFGIDTTIAFSLIITYCLRKVTMRNNYFKLLLLMLVLDNGIKYSDYAIAQLLYSNIDSSVINSIFSCIIAVIISIGILILTRLVMNHLKCFRPKRLKWIHVSVTERNILIALAILAIILKIIISIYRFYSCHNLFDLPAGDINFNDIIGLLVARQGLNEVASMTNLVLLYCFVKLVFCPVKRIEKLNN